jgi:CubicO group peptidase (beta-lactamase class C family)
MKLYEQGKLKLEAPLKTYLPWVKGTNKENLVVRDVLLHQAGLVAFIPFFRETLDSTGIPDTSRIYATSAKKGFSVRVTDGLYLRDDWRDSIRQRIVKSPLGPSGKYVYSDLDFILLGEIVEQISGKSLDQFTQENLYRPLGMYSTGFRPRNRFLVTQIVPTETEKHFRRSKIRGDVHDEGASILGGIAGHAGLFSNAYDLAILYQMLLDKGTFNGRRFFKPSTVNLFTSYQLKDSRRGLGFDKPERDNNFKKDTYPSLLATSETFGHTGFTGTCVWVDPKHELVYVFLSNRVYPTRNNNLLGQLQIRGRIQDAIYRALGADEE